MPPDEFLAALKRLGFARSDAANDLGLSEAARIIGYSPRQVRAWSIGANPIPPGVAFALRLMLKLKLSADKVRDLLGRDIDG